MTRLLRILPSVALFALLAAVAVVGGLVLLETAVGLAELAGEV